MLGRLFRQDNRSRLVDAAINDLAQMLGQSAKMLDDSLGALLQGSEIEEDLRTQDDVVDEGERMVRRTILEHLAVNPEQDLVASLILVSIVQDAERIGDFARGIAELIPLARHPREGEFADRLGEAADRLRPLFALTEEAFREDDVDKARQVEAAAAELKQVFIDYTSDVAASDLSADMAVVYVEAARSLRRVGAHLSNICSTVSQPFDRIRHSDEEA